jgi:hypothetical protein
VAQDRKDNPGFALPAPQIAAASESSTTTATTTSTSSTSGTTEVSSQTTFINAYVSSRDLLIGGAILLLLFVAFLFARSAYANMLVGKRVPPTKANASGWWLFVFLESLATGVVLVGVNTTKFLNGFVIGPASAIAVVALLLTFISGRK